MADRVLGGRYRIGRHLARGGMAEVYIAEDELLSRTVAVKVLFPELAADDSFVERFRREARAAASLNHHNIVSVYDFGEDEESWYIVMEYVDGPTLRDIIRRDGPMEPTTATEIAAEVAAALVAAHAQGIVHRDVKPANVLIASGTGTVKVTDFGIARAANALQGLTMPGTVLGTATYLSPEQAQGKEVDSRTDIYSLGLVLYEMLAGRPPFSGDTPMAIAYQSVRETPPPPSTHNPRVSGALDAVVMKALSKPPAARQASAEELRDELLAVDRATGAPDATVAIAPAAATGEPTAIATPATSILPPVAPPDVQPVRPYPPGSAGGVPPEVYRRRRAAVIAGLAALAILAIVVLAALNRGGNRTQTKVAVPDVVGRPVADARTTIDGAGLKSEVSEEDRAEAAGRVAEQRPASGEMVDRGSSVTLVVPRATSTTTARVAPTTVAPSTAPTTTVARTTLAPSTTAAPTTVAPTTTATSTPISLFATTSTSRP